MKIGSIAPAGNTIRRADPSLRFSSANRKSLLHSLDAFLIDAGQLVDLLDHLPERRAEPLLHELRLSLSEHRIDAPMTELKKFHRRHVDLRDLRLALLHQLQLALHLSAVPG
jgi:hypothetical protein